MEGSNLESPPDDFRREERALDAGTIAEAVGRGDIDELLRLVEQLATARDWGGLADLRTRCDRAYEDTGRQLWPIAANAAYRLALDAPAQWAATVLVDDGDRFTLGPLPEVAAQGHTWSELAPHLAPGAAAVLTAHERVLRGEDLAGAQVAGPAVLELPLHLERWEPVYALAHYRSDAADFDSPPAPRTRAVELPDRPATLPADEGAVALLDLTRTWAESSNGRADVALAEGSALDAIAALGPPRARVVEVDGAAALAWMAWAGASGGAHGRRPGAAAGRFAAWWALAAVAGLLDDWPPDADALARELERLRWLLWDAAEPVTGWALHLAVEDQQRGRAWAVAAVDAA
jgi:hypothetical protein